MEVGPVVKHLILMNCSTLFSIFHPKNRLFLVLLESKMPDKTRLGPLCASTNIRCLCVALCVSELLCVLIHCGATAQSPLLVFEHDLLTADGLAPKYLLIFKRLTLQWSTTLWNAVTITLRNYDCRCLSSEGSACEWEVLYG